jgi:hypothetical protein
MERIVWSRYYDRVVSGAPRSLKPQVMRAFRDVSPKLLDRVVDESGSVIGFGGVSLYDNEKFFIDIRGPKVNVVVI